MNNKDIDDICVKFGIENYTINTDGSIDVNDDVYLCDFCLEFIPLKFNIVIGSFNCYGNNLTSLDGCPIYVGGYFDCSFNNLRSLKGGPSEVLGYYDCSCNNIETLDGCPNEVDILHISNNNLKSLDGINIPYEKLDHFIGIKKLIRKNKLSNYLDN